MYPLFVFVDYFDISNIVFFLLTSTVTITELNGFDPCKIKKSNTYSKEYLPSYYTCQGIAAKRESLRRILIFIRIYSHMPGGLLSPLPFCPVSLLLSTHEIRREENGERKTGPEHISFFVCVATRTEHKTTRHNTARHSVGHSGCIA